MCDRCKQKVIGSCLVELYILYMSSDLPNRHEDKSVIRSAIPIPKDRVLEITTGLLRGEGLDATIERIVQICKELGFDRTRLYLATDGGQCIVGVAQVGMGDGFVGSSRRVEEDAYIEALIRTPGPRLFSVCRANQRRSRTISATGFQLTNGPAFLSFPTESWQVSFQWITSSPAAPWIKPA
jgi:hypothetical protein